VLEHLEALYRTYHDADIAHRAADLVVIKARRDRAAAARALSAALEAHVCKHFKSGVELETKVKGLIRIEGYSSPIWRPDHVVARARRKIVARGLRKSELDFPWGKTLYDFPTVLWDFDRDCWRPGVHDMELNRVVFDDEVQEATAG
jgi:hypothetical protein